MVNRFHRATWGAFGLFGAVTSVAACGSSASDSSDASDGGALDASAPQGDANYALHFNGTSDYATTGTANFPAGAAPQTVSLWVRPETYDGTQVFITLRLDEQSGVVLGILNGTISAWRVYGSPPAKPPLVDASAPEAGSWHHVAYVFEGEPDSGTSAGLGPAVLYLDGKALATNLYANPNRRTPLSCWMGSSDGLSSFYSGDLDELRIWNVARSAAEVVEDMNGQVSDRAPGLVAYFNFNTIEGGDIVLDESGNGNNATLGGGAPSAIPTQVKSTVPPQQ
jgi:hypothetical protein